MNWQKPDKISTRIEKLICLLEKEFEEGTSESDELSEVNSELWDHSWNFIQAWGELDVFIYEQMLAEARKD